MAERTVDLNAWWHLTWRVTDSEAVLYLDGEESIVVAPGCASGGYLDFVQTVPIPVHSAANRGSE